MRNRIALGWIPASCQPSHEALWVHAGLEPRPLWLIMSSANDSLAFGDSRLSLRLRAPQVVQEKQTYIAARNDAVSPCADHAGLDHGAPPVLLGAGGVVDHGQEALLKGVRDGPVGCKRGRRGR